MYINLIQIFRQMVVHNYYEINDKKAEQFRRTLLSKYVYKDEYNVVNGRISNVNQSGPFNFNMKRFSLALANRSFGTFASQNAHSFETGPNQQTN